MATTYYVDPTATGDDDGTTAEHAWSTLQRAIDGTDGTQPTAGDTILCYANGSTADETITATIDIDGDEGTAIAFINIVGVNSSGVEDGTRYIVEGDSGTIPVNILLVANKDYMEFRNFDLSGASGSGMDFTSTCSYINLKNIKSDDNGVYGFNLKYAYYAKIDCCVANNNDDSGFYYNSTGSSLTFCVANDNGANGYLVYGPMAIYGCIAHRNTAKGLYGPGIGGSVINCVFDGNATGVEAYKERTLYIGNRFTNNTNDGFDHNLKHLMYGYNYFHNNDTDEKDVAISSLDLGGSEEDTGADDGYNNVAAEDFNLKTTASLRDIEITLPE